MKVPPYILLTGAGFTAGVDGYLADQMWEQIFNDPRVVDSDYLRQTLLNNGLDYNFELALEKVRQDRPDQAQILMGAIHEAYQRLDWIVKEYELKIRADGLRAWLRRFSGEQFGRGHTGLIFSLNQDLFLERLSFTGRYVPHLPGVPEQAQAYPVKDRQGMDLIAIGNAVCREDDLRALNVVKLHGSCNWTIDGSTAAMVIGAQKEESIARYPLLKSYFQLFREALRQTKQLWVFGYGFGDPHVNRLIAEAATRGLEICVIDYCRPKSFLQTRRGNDSCGPIMDSIYGFVPNSLRGIFPTEGSQLPYSQIDRLMMRVEKAVA